MRYFNIETKMPTNDFVDEATTMPSSDPRVKEFFKPLPDNHRLEFTEEGLPLIIEIPSPTQEQQDRKEKDKRMADIDTRLSEIDILSIRSLRSKSNGRSNSGDDAKLTELDDEAIILRTERGTLTA